MNALIDSLKSRSNFLATSKQQLNSDKSKAGFSKRQESLAANLKLIENQIAQIKKMMNEIFEQYLIIYFCFIYLSVFLLQDTVMNFIL